MSRKIAFNGKRVLTVGLMVVLLVTSVVLLNSAQISSPRSGQGDWNAGFLQLADTRNGTIWHLANRGTLADANNPFEINFFNGSDWRGPYLKITKDGKVGIGTARPEALFHVNGGRNYEWGMILSSTGGSAYGLKINHGWYGHDIPILQVNALDETTEIPRFVIKANGNVGIGTMSPAAKLHVVGNFVATGTKSFSVPHPLNPSKQIVYVSLEGPEAGTYIRGTAQLINGQATIELPEHFSLVTSEEGLTVQLTPWGECNGLFVAERSTSKIVIKELHQGTSNVKFDYLVQGVRKGYENHQVIRGKKE